MASNTLNVARPRLPFPSPLTTVFHLIFQSVLLGLVVVTFITLWSRAPAAAFAVFFVWTVFFYSVMIIAACRLRPHGSVIAALYSRLPYYPREASAPTPPQIPTQESPPGPYVHHQPPSRVLSSPIGSYPHSHGPRSVEISDDDDDLDEDTRQRMIEEEMGRRDVSIVTVPKRKLWIANPS